MEQNVYYTIVNNWFLSQYIDISSNDIDAIISNIEELLKVLKNLKDKRIQYTIKEETIYQPRAIVFFTHEKAVADNIFKNGYLMCENEYFLKEHLDEMNLIDALNVESDFLAEVEGKSLKDNLYDNVIDDQELIIKHEPCSIQAEDNLSDDLFDDLADIGLSTLEKELDCRSQTEGLPEELFDDLIVKND